MDTFHLLVVEDDPDINRLLCRISSDAGYRRNWASMRASTSALSKGLEIKSSAPRFRAFTRVTLTARELEILALLMGHPKKVYTREQIYQQVWGEEYMGDDNTVNVHVSNLRAKLAKVSDMAWSFCSEALQ